MPRRVLIVDDEPQVLRALKRLLADDFEVYTATSAREALQIVESEPPFKVIATDVRMPGMNGITLAKHIEQLSPNTVMIVFSSKEDDENQQISQLTNRKACLTKPFTIEKLRSAIEGFLLVDT